MLRENTHDCHEPAQPSKTPAPTRAVRINGTELSCWPSDIASVTKALNDHFGSSHSERTVRHHAWRWGLKIVRKPAIISGAPIGLRLPVGSLMERLVALLPKNLARDHRDDLISDIAMLVFEGRVPESDLEANVR
jgi:hypothetical protein